MWTGKGTRAPRRRWLGAIILMAGVSSSGADTLVYAVNVGGDAYTAKDGTPYIADDGRVTGERGVSDKIKGSQNPELYQTYRFGDVGFAMPIDDGRYDVTLKFAEPDDINDRERVFSVFFNGEKRIHDLDVKIARDGKIRSNLTVTIPDVAVDTGALQLRFEASAGVPVLHGIVVHRVQPRDDDWNLVWSDEFSTDGALDPEKWNYDIWDPRKVNDEDQAYTDRDRNVRVENGYLTIEAHREDYGDARYTSARVHTAGKGDMLYGRAEIRARLPRGQGTWAAIWMLPTDPFKYATICGPGHDWQGAADCDAWPNSGEIDILEHVGYEMGHVHGTVHNKAYYWIEWEQRKGRILDDDVAETFHTYALEWTPERIDIFVDDARYFTYMNEGEGWEAWPYDHPFHLILNVAVGGYWGRAGGPIDDAIFPQRMLVDWVRIYERDAP